VNDPDSSAHDSRARARDSGTVPHASGDVELTPIDVVRDLEPEDRLAVVRARAVELMERCPAHVPRSEHGYPVGRANCTCIPERGFRVGMIRRLMEDHYWLPDGQPYDRALGDVFGLAASTIRNDASVAAMHLRSTEDPEVAEQRKRDGTNRTEDWAHEAWALGDRRTAAVLNEQALKASRAIVAGTTQVNVDIKAAIAVLFNEKTQTWTDEGRKLVGEMASGMVDAAINHFVDRLPVQDRQAERDAAWAKARGVGQRQ
jgi:hypothetical protein